MRVFLAGATGAIGRPLVERLIADRHHVVGTTRTEAGADQLREAGAVPAVFDAQLTDSLLTNVMFGADPDVVINELTSLPKEMTPDALAEGVARTTDLRRSVYPRLAEAASASGAKRLIVQSTAFDPSDGSDVRDVIESSALEIRHIETVILRYGYFYGPGTWHDARPEGDGPYVHIDKAVEATVAAISETAPGTHLVVD